VRPVGGAALLAAGLVRAGAVVVRRVPPTTAARWGARNFRGDPVSMLAGPLVVGSAMAAGAVSPGVPAAAVVAALGAVAAGRYDDVVGARPDQRGDKGFRGHLAAVRQGRLSAGAVKVFGIGGTALAATILRGTRRPAEVLVDTALLAGTANLVNLLDLRPGRAAKAVVLAAAVGATAAPTPVRGGFEALLGAAVASLPEDLGETTMLGDAGANGLGILLGLAAAEATRPPLRLALAAGVAGLTVASERVSFSAVIDRTPPLAWLDGLGRRA
jgi:UDP-N-acetylmuramyl pentapeptide phosphotransferase/UDP-N-acetylglucosamine-1-phosphate transferase